MSKTLVMNEIGTGNEDIQAETTAATTQRAIDKLMTRVRKLYATETYSTPFELGDALNDLQAELKKKLGKASNQKLAELLSIGLTSQRISSLRLTAEHFQNGCRKPTFSFKEYERVRKAEQQKAGGEDRKMRDGKTLLAAMEAGETFGGNDETENKLTLTIKVSVENSDSETPKISSDIKANGKDIGEPLGWMSQAAQDAIDALRRKFAL